MLFKPPPEPPPKPYPKPPPEPPTVGVYIVRSYKLVYITAKKAKLSARTARPKPIKKPLKTH